MRGDVLNTVEAACSALLAHAPGPADSVSVMTQLEVLFEPELPDTAVVTFKNLHLNRAAASVDAGMVHVAVKKIHEGLGYLRKEIERAAAAGG